MQKPKSRDLRSGQGSHFFALKRQPAFVSVEKKKPASEEETSVREGNYKIKK